MIAATLPTTKRAFEFERDTFAYAHELVWQYHFDANGAMTVSRSDPAPTYYHRCFVMVRATRQFFYHARFNPELPQVDAQTYQELVRKVVARDVRRQCAEEDRITIPGFNGLRSFSRAHEPLLKAECGAAWESYVLRSHWRMIFPTPRWYRRWMFKKIKIKLVNQYKAVL